MWFGRFPTRHRLSSSSFVRRALAAGLVCAIAGPGLRGLAQEPVRPAGTAPTTDEVLLAAAAKSEADLRFDLATSQLYDVLIEHPGTGGAATARLRLARLLALNGNLPAAILECQLLRDELPADTPMRERALELASVLVRRLRAANGQVPTAFATLEGLSSRGLPALDEPRRIHFENEGRFLLLDEGSRKLYRVGADGATLLSTPADPSAVTTMPDGAVLVAGKTGLATIPPTRPIALSGTWGGKARPLKKIRSMAFWSTGDLLLIDKDYDGILRCQLAAGTCAPWGPVGKYRTVLVGASDWVYLLDDRGQTVRVLDPAQRALAVIGPLVGAAKLERVEDMAVDSAHGLYLLDTGTKRIVVIHLKSMGDGKVAPTPAPALLLPQEGERAVKNPSAIAVSPTGWLAVASKSSPRVMRWR